MEKKRNINGIILAGGKSERMGTSKAFLEYKGKPFIWYCIEAMKPLVKELFIVSDDPRLDAFGVLRIPDEIKNAGPVGGLFSGLLHSDTAYNLVLSCDVPCIETSMLQRLIDAIEGNLDVIQLASNANAHPLIALYHKRCIHLFKEQLDNNERRLQTILASLKTKTIYIEGKLAKQMKNINTKIEYNALTHGIDD